MPKFKLSGGLIAELPEIEIEADNIEEAKEKYIELYNNDKIGVDENSWDILFGDDEFDEGDEETPIFLNGLPLKNCKIYGLKEEDMPNEVLDNIEYVIYYKEKGFECLGGISDESRIMKFKRKIDKEQKRLV